MTTTTADNPGMTASDVFKCRHEDHDGNRCGRIFLDEATLSDHAEAVHTFDDTQQILSDMLKEKYGQKGNPKNNVPWIWVWVRDVAADWVVFRVEKGDDSTMYKVSYTIGGDQDSEVTLGEPFEVVRRTVYDKVENGKTDGTA